MNKKIVYISPDTHVMRLIVENLLAKASNQDYTTPELSDAKESNFEGEEALPTQPNLWGDEEE